MAERVTPFGKYFLLERINVGGMAEVYKAKTVGVEGFEKIVAIKRILPSVAEDEEFIRMFIDEAKIASQLSHANLAQTFDLGKIDDAYYIAMEYVRGKDLRAIFERVKRRGERIPLEIAAWVMGRVCEGLDYAHRKRDASGRALHIVHRDVSPQNIVLSCEGEVKLIDFGIAKAASKMTRTQAGILKGKFGYMSPEQVRGLALDGRSDIFAAGVVLYELCTGERLFTGASDASVLEKVQQAQVTPPTQLEPSIPLRLERIILKALAREPEDRYQQAAEVASELTRFLLEWQQRPVTRDDLSAFMKATFPEEAGEVVGAGDPDRTVTVAGPAPQVERAEIIVKRRSPIAIVGVALLIAAWALLSSPRPRGPRSAARAGMAGALEPAATLARGEPKTLKIALPSPQNPVVVLSSPAGAQVWVDGEKQGQTPAWIALPDPSVPHAVSVEKTCYRAWQMAVPPGSGPRELAATLQPAPGVCPGSQLEAAGMPAPADLPDDATATLGFLNLGSRPPAQVLIDGVDIGQTTPLLAWPLHNGSHKLTLVGNGGSKEVAVEIRAGETSSTIVDLSKPKRAPVKATHKRRGRH